MNNTDKKLREARFFLDKMREQERAAFGDKEHFDFYLSAFLNAVRNVDYRLRHQERAYAPWRQLWNDTHSEEDDLLKFMSDDRDLEVHESGSARIVQTREIKVGPGSFYSDSSGRLEVFGTPAPIAGREAGATIGMPHYVYTLTVDGTERPVTEVCTESLKVLERLVTEFKAHLRER